MEAAVRRLEGRIAVVTAGASGMGRSSAVRFAAEGAHVYVADLDGGKAAEVATEIKSAGGSAVAVGLDVTDRDGLQALVADIERDHGVLHVLYNHAGIPGP